MAPLSGIEKWQSQREIVEIPASKLGIIRTADYIGVGLLDSTRQ